ncbi:uncharacterized protein LOC133791797 [Humulus lupulus]|uniref:uncharacterized protein LOC133791797 n=1 Tax=Humulus lupulus TaxID=3486 RepID=UPI002B418208|nr:uncharacterized protein LOC133791797 [Humulus lupulus]
MGVTDYNPILSIRKKIRKSSTKSSTTSTSASKYDFVLLGTTQVANCLDCKSHKSRSGEEEARQSPVDQTLLSEDKDALNGSIDAGTQKLVTKELAKPQEMSKHLEPVSSVVKHDVTPDTNSSDRGTLDWVTPKRVGGNKKATHRAKNTLTNSYSALQDKVLEVTNLGLTTTSALLETKLRGDKIEKMMHSFFIGWNYFTGAASEGRLLLIWQQNLVSVEVLKETDQLLHVCVKGLRTNKLFCVTFVYGRNSIEERVPLWSDLSGLWFPATPWLLAGDFNAVFEGTYRIGGRAISSLELTDAQNWRALGLVDELRARGSHFTWTNKHANEDRIYSKLDRVFKNEDWLDLYPQAEVVFNWELLSDHCYCIIKPEASVNCGIKLFRKLSRLQIVLRKFNKHVMGDVVQNYVLAKEKFQAAQLSLQSNPHSVELQRVEAAAGDNFEYRARTYESFLRQKSKVDWLRYGDDNTAYFHACLKQRRAINCITSVMTESGQIIENFDDVVEHFQISLVRPFTTKEVKDALFSINSIKSPGPDGYGSGFFKVLWSDLEAEISEAIIEFFESGNLPEEVNKATISLIPKIDTPTRAADYRPIACCNSIYKCISTMLCGRLAMVLPSLVHQNQGAFVKNRLLAHNILILQDIIKGYKRKNISPRCVMKIDLSKAYDMLDWNFLEDILTEFCFPDKFIKWAMACLKDPTD